MGNGLNIRKRLKMIKNIHRNSLSAYAVLKKTDRYEAIMKAYESIKSPLTDRDVKEILGFPDMNNVRPRITELIDQGKLKEVGTELDLVTNTRVRICRPTTPEDNKQESFL
jgi:hypothetical protein